MCWSAFSVSQLFRISDLCTNHSDAQPVESTLSHLMSWKLAFLKLETYRKFALNCIIMFSLFFKGTLRKSESIKCKFVFHILFLCALLLLLNICHMHSLFNFGLIAFKCTGTAASLVVIRIPGLNLFIK